MTEVRKKNATKKIDATTDDFGTICVCAVRYALGRMTYMPSLVQDYIRPLLPYIELRALDVIARDIREFGGLDHRKEAYGWDCDYEGWMRFLAECNAEIERRKEDGE